MFSLKKRYVVIVGILGGFAIAFQDQLHSGWLQFQRQPALHSNAPTTNLPTPLPSNWDGQESSLSPSAGLATNTSLGDHFRSQPRPVDSSRDPKPGLMVSTSTGNSRPRNPNEIATVRIASFNMQGFGESKLKKVAVVETIVRMLRQFDVIALQHIQSRQQNILPELIDKMNQSDRRFDYCIGPRVGPEGSQRQFAFLFDTDRIETDRQMLYTVDDPQRLLEYEPLVGWFRSRSVPSDQAFTFSLVNVCIDPLSSAQELKMLPDLIRSVRRDGRMEDDIILLGDFGCSDRELTSLQNIGMLFALEGIPTTVTGEAMLDNIVFPSRATDEFTGKSGVVDFLRQGNLSIDQAFQIGTHMPIWGEFFAIEGGSPGYLGIKTDR